MQVQSATPCSKKSKQTKTTKKLTPQTTLSLSLSVADTSRPAARSRMLTHAGFGKWQPVLRTERMIGCKAFSLAMVGRRAATSKSRESDFTSISECGAGTSVTSRPLYTATNQHSGIRRCGVRERNVGRCAGHSFVEFLPFRFPLRRLQRRERIGPLSGGGNSEGRGGCWHTWAG